MSEEETKANKGRILVELSEVEAELAKWRDSAREAARDLRVVANQMDAEPERLVFSGEETPLEFQNQAVLMSGPLNLQAICEIRNHIRKLELRRRELQRSKSAYGL
jgi:hypothetical protein